MEDLRRAIALLFRRSGGTPLTEKEFVLSASMDLRWFPPKDAQRLLDVGIRTGLLVSEEGRIRPAFDVNTVEVPLDFVPTPAALDVPEAQKDIFIAVLARILEATGQERKAVVAEVNRVQGRMGIDFEVAALVVARSHGVGIDDLLDAVASKFRSG